MRGFLVPLALSLLFAVPAAAAAHPAFFDAVQGDIPLYICFEGGIPEPSSQPCNLCYLPICSVSVDLGRAWDMLR